MKSWYAYAVRADRTADLVECADYFTADRERAAMIRESAAWGYTDVGVFDRPVTISHVNRLAGDRGWSVRLIRGPRPVETAPAVNPEQLAAARSAHPGVLLVFLVHVDNGPPVYWFPLAEDREKVSEVGLPAEFHPGHLERALGMLLRAGHRIAVCETAKGGEG